MQPEKLQAYIIKVSCVICIYIAIDYPGICHVHCDVISLSKYSEQQCMGSLLSPIVANIFMDDIVTCALEMSLCKPKMWLR